jgi:CIC family chloride channel protein
MSEAYILEENNSFIGKVTLQKLLLAEPKTKITSLLEQDPISIKSDASLQQAMEIAVEFVGESIPIIDRETNEMLGIVTEGDLFKDYLQLQNKIVDLERR